MLPDFQEIESGISNGIPLPELELRLQPGEYSDGGFLAPGERLLEVIRKDHETLQRLGTDYEKMARLAYIISDQEKSEFLTARKESYPRKTSECVRYDKDRFTVEVALYAGFQICPWGCIGIDQYGFSTVSNYTLYMTDRTDKKAREFFERFYGGHDQIWKDCKKEFMVGDLREPEQYLAADQKRMEELNQRTCALDHSLGIVYGGEDRVRFLTSFVVLTDLTPHLIASHFFFEGAASYRTDPEKLTEFAGVDGEAILKR